MEPIKTLAERADALGVLPSMIVKSELGRKAVLALAAVEGLVLQGGGALHHVYGSPRFSADLDYAQGDNVLDEQVRDALDALRARVAADWGECELGPLVSRGKLRREKLRARVRPGTIIVLAVERYEVPVHRLERRPLTAGPEIEQLTVAVEAPAEILADKIAASIDRLRTRGSIKLRDVFDLEFLLDRTAADRDLVLTKLADYGLSPDLGPLDEAVEMLDTLAAEELVAQLRGVLPRADLEALRPRRTLARTRHLFRELAR